MEQSFKNRKFSKKKIYLQNNLYKFFVWRIKRKGINSSLELNTYDFPVILYKQYNLKKSYSSYFSKIQLNNRIKLDQENILLHDTLVLKTNINNLETSKLPTRQSLKPNFPKQLTNLSKFRISKKQNLGQLRKTTCLAFFSHFANFFFFSQKKSMASLTPGTFFPHKKSFLCYWVLPFIGFVALTYSKQNYNHKFINNFQLWPFLTSNNNLSKPTTSIFNFLTNSQNSSLISNHNSSSVKDNNKKLLDANRISNTIAAKKVFRHNIPETEVLNISPVVKNTINSWQKTVVPTNIFTDSFQTKTIKSIFIVDSLVEQTQNKKSIFVYQDKNLLKEYSKFLDIEKNQLKNICNFYIYKTKNWLCNKITKTDVFLNEKQILKNVLITSDFSKFKWFWFNLDSLPNILLRSRSNYDYIRKNLPETKIVNKNCLTNNQTNNFVFNSPFYLEKSQNWNLNFDEFPKKLNLTNGENLIKLKALTLINDTNTKLSKSNFSINKNRQSIDNVFIDKKNLHKTISSLTKQPILDYNNAKILLDKYITLFKYENFANFKNDSKRNTFWTSTNNNSLQSKIFKAKKSKFKLYELKNSYILNNLINKFVITKNLDDSGNNKIKFLNKRLLSKTSILEPNLLAKKQNLESFFINKKLEKLFLLKVLRKNVIALLSNNEKSLLLKNKNLPYKISTKTSAETKLYSKNFKKYIFELSLLKYWKNKQSCVEFKKNLTPFYFLKLKKIFSTSSKLANWKLNDVTLKFPETHVSDISPSTIVEDKNPDANASDISPKTSVLDNNPAAKSISNKLPENFTSQMRDFTTNYSPSLNLVNIFLAKNIIQYTQPILMSGYNYPELNLKPVLSWRHNFNNNFQKENSWKPSLNYLDDNLEILKSLDNTFTTLKSNENYLTNKKMLFSNEKKSVNSDSNPGLVYENQVSEILSSITAKKETEFSKNKFQHILDKYIESVSTKLATILNSQKIELLKKHNCQKNTIKVEDPNPAIPEISNKLPANKICKNSVPKTKVFDINPSTIVEDTSPVIKDNSNKLPKTDVLDNNPSTIVEDTSPDVSHQQQILSTNRRRQNIPEITKKSVLKISKIQTESKKLCPKKLLPHNNISVKKPENRKIEKLLRTFLSNKYIQTESTINVNFKKNNFANNDLLIDSDFKVPYSDLNFQSKKELIKIVLSNLKYRKKTIKIHQNQYLNIFKNSKKRVISNNPKFDSTKNSSFSTNQLPANKVCKNSVSKNSIPKTDVLDNNPYYDRISNKFSTFSMKRPLASSSLLKRIGFIFLNQTDKEILEKNNQSTLIRFEKNKSQQKKRRRKKLKLENRRRKKRKRFYPRPQWIRTHLLNKFNKMRHGNKYSTDSLLEVLDNNPVIKDNSNKLPKTKVLDRNSDASQKQQRPLTYKSSQNQNLIKSLNFKKFESVNNKKILYKKNLDNYIQEKNLLLRQKIYRSNKQKWSDYSSESLNFEKLTLKKYTYQKILPIYANHNLYQISNTLMSDFQRLCWKSYWMRTNLNPYIERIKNYLNKLDNSEKNWQFRNNWKRYIYTLLGFSISPNSYNFLIPEFFGTQKEKNSLLIVKNQATINRHQELGFLNIKNSLEQINYISHSSLFLNSINLAEYNRIQFERISDIIKNVKNNLNVNGQNKARSYKRGRQKNVLIIENNYWRRLAQSINPEINAFSFFSQFSSPSIKPYGELPTVRALWALNKTNLLNFKEANQTKNLWIALKNREQRKSNKTKKFLSKMYKKLGSVKLTSENFNKKNSIPHCFQKIDHSENKMRYLGFVGTKLKTYLRNFKIKLKKSFVRKSNLQSLSAKSISDKSHFYYTKSQNFKKYSYLEQIPLRNSVIKKSPKNSTQFWWSTKELNLQSFLYTSNFKLNDFSFVPSPNLLTFGMYSKTPEFFESSLWACTILFHICALFSLIRISEIRSLFKFHLLLFCKLSNIYLLVTYSIFNSLKDYKKQIIKFKSSVKKWFFEINSSTIRRRQKSFTTKVCKNSVAGVKNISNKLPANKVCRNSIPKTDVLDNNPVIKDNSNKLPKTDVLDNNPVIKDNSNKLPKTSVEDKHSNVEDISNKLPETEILDKNPNILKIRKKFSTTNLTYILELTNLPNYEKIINSSPKNTKTIFDRLFYSFYKNAIKFIPLLNSISYKSNLNIQSEKNIVSLKLKDANTTLSQLLLNINKQVKTLVTLCVFSSVTMSINFLNNCSVLFYSFLLKILDILESFMVIIYKFLEKPAELMIEWIAQIFLLEWSSDLYTYAPESLDIYMWNSFSKLSRNLRSIVLNSSFFGGFLLQRRMWCFMELFLDYIMKPDSDLLIRQKKGLIFWEVWAEILIQAAEEYNVNIPSLTTLKEEQELLIERLLEDENWNWCQLSMYQMAPLISIVKNPTPVVKDHSNQWMQTNNFYKNNNVNINIKNNHLFLNNYLKNKSKNQLNVVTSQTIYFDKWKRWSANQYFTYQGRDTDLFIDIHPPKSFQHMSTIKYYEPSHQPIGTLVCQIYSGVFSKQVSKNILVVGAGSVGKSLLIQALAGETELKIMTDNAHRYAMVQRGVAVGMKLLRDVFEAIALHTPCLFLMEDIHVIGERRPMLISDDENAKAADLSFGSSSDEVHEKNQVIYQLSRHAVSHYKKPYKGDFSLLIPTNHFCFDLFLGVTPPKTRKAGITPEHPLPINTIQNDLEHQNNSNSNFSNSNEKVASTLVSRLQLTTEKLFAPPATSPFTVLMMKEQKKMKPRKVVKEIPWSGLSSDQMLLLPKVTYSVRVKVAMLADIAISNLSVKLDMITDLLVIIDSVRSNRGFVVFATTHVPYMLDPALRRPGRLDETISLPLLPNLVSRLEILKTNLLSCSSTLDFLDVAILTQSLNETQISNMISKSKLLLLNMSSKQIFSYKQPDANASDISLSTNVEDNNPDVSDINNKLPPNKICKNFGSVIKSSEENFVPTTLSCLPISSIHQASYLIFNKLMDLSFYVNKHSNNRNFKNLETKVASKCSKNQVNNNFVFKNPTNVRNLKTSNLLAGTYFRVSKFLITSTILSDQTSYGLILWNNLPNLESSEESIFADLYSPSYDLKNHLLKLLSGKVGEFFVFNNYRAIQNLEKPDTRVLNISSFNNLYQNGYTNFIPNLGPKLWNLAGIDKFWHSTTSFVFSLIHKRYLYSKNLLVSRLFYFQDVSILKEPPSPPGSSILNPSKNYENFRRTMLDSQQRAVFSINEKIQLHQQQRFVKKLYNKKIKEYFNSEMIENRQTFFSSSFKELGYLDNFTRRPTSINCYYRNRILTRHKYYFTNQWWNGQLAEHNSETTFLSDVDWRSMFVNSLGDLVIDFPDADQHYNPRKRKWMLNSGYWGYWLNFEKTFQSEIYYHFIMECFNSATNSLNSQREILDYFAYLFLRKGILKEIDLITTLSRFK